MKYSGKNILVCGMARSGIAAACLLKKLGANVTLQDLKEKEVLGDLTDLEAKGIQLYTGKNPDDIVLKQDMIIVSPGIPCDLPFILKAENAGIPVLSEIELAYTITPCSVIAITGTNGKTTTTTLIGEMLKTHYSNTAVVGNIGVAFSEKVESLTKEDYVVAEISSFQLEKIKTFHPKISAVLNITPDHLNRHKTLENYIATKERIFENQTEEDICILNYEDETCRKMAQKTKANVFFFSSINELERGIYLKNDHIILKWEDKNEIVINISDLQILGIHNYENVMAAVAAAVCANISLENIRKILMNFTGVEHRIEYVATIDDVDYYNDSKGTNPDAAIRAVLAMKKPTILIGGGYDKDSDYKQWIASFKNKVKHLVLIGVTAPKIKKEAQEMGFTAITMCDTFFDAVCTCHQLAQKGDCVLLSPACASWDMFESYEQRGDLFKQYVKGFLKQ